MTKLKSVDLIVRTKKNACRKVSDGHVIPFLLFRYSIVNNYKGFLGYFRNSYKVGKRLQLDISSQW